MTFSQAKHELSTKLPPKKKRAATALFTVLQICSLTIILGIPQVATAKDWYVRPAGGAYGVEDGASYQNAWDGFENIDWSESGVQPGDGLLICGKHYTELILGGSGTASEAITIDGDCPESPGIIDGGQTTRNGVNTSGHSYLSIKNLRLVRMAYHGLYITSTKFASTKNVSVENVTAFSNNKSGIFIVSYEYNFPVENITVRAGSAYLNGAYGLKVTGNVKNVVVERFEAYSNSQVDASWGIAAGAYNLGVTSGWKRETGNVYSRTLYLDEPSWPYDIAGVVDSSSTTRLTRAEKPYPALGQFFWEPTSKKLYVNVGTNPNLHQITYYKLVPDSIHFVECISHHNPKPSADNIEGIGIGFDEYTKNSAIKRCLAYSNEGAGIQLHRTTNCNIAHSISRQNGEDGIRVNAYSLHSAVYNNLSYSNARNGFAISGTDNHHVYINNNIASENKGYGLHLGPSATNIFHDFNLFFNNTSGAANGPVGPIGNHSREQDPLFQDAENHDFALKAESPCVNAGIQLSENNDLAILPGSIWPNKVATDLANRYRGWEIGPYIYAGSDTDNDGLPEEFEKTFGLNPLISDADSDADNDGLTNIQEFLLGSRPGEYDTDADGIDDFSEAALALNPNSPDSDHDGIDDNTETGVAERPLDTDSDGIIDALDFDSDNDGISDKNENGMDGDEDGIDDRIDRDTASTKTSQGTLSIIVLQGDGYLCDVHFVGYPIESETLPPFDFPYGGIDYKVSGLDLGQHVEMAIRTTASLHLSTELWKYNRKDGYYNYPASINGNTLSFTLRDGSPGDDDATVNGTIEDPGYIALPMETYNTGQSSEGSAGCSLSASDKSATLQILDLLTLLLPIALLKAFGARKSRHGLWTDTDSPSA